MTSETSVHPEVGDNEDAAVEQLPVRRWRGPGIVVAALGMLALLLGAFWIGFAAQPTTPGDDSAEAGFARDMMVHHAQAVQMAGTVRGQTRDPVLRAMAVDIELTQQAQIGQLQGWLDQWGLPATGSQPAMAWMSGSMAGAMSGSMPGMATPQELERLSGARPPQQKTLFLRLMIRHHAAAIDMANAVLLLTDRPEVRRFAENTIAAQSAEIETMRQLLRNRA